MAIEIWRQKIIVVWEKAETKLHRHFGMSERAKLTWCGDESSSAGTGNGPVYMVADKTDFVEEKRNTW